MSKNATAQNCIALSPKISWMARIKKIPSNETGAITTGYLCPAQTVAASRRRSFHDIAPPSAIIQALSFLFGK
jgi:hypothetical protein